MDAVESSERVGLGAAPAPTRAYARLSSRVNAVLIDTVIVGFGFVTLMIVASFFENVRHSGGIFLAMMFGWLLLYEPLQVWRFGATIGHRRANIRIVSDRTGAPPSFLASCGRFLVKSLLGFPSFVSMSFTRRHQSIHDLLTRTTVQLRDLSIVTTDDYLVERVPDTVAITILPTRSRRIVVMLTYIIGAYFLSGVLSFAFMSEACLSKAQCSTSDRADSKLLAYLLLASILAIVIQGWRGRLWGARSHIELAPLATIMDADKPPGSHYP
ncbi:MAG TPA: RDD family protein [Gemmatimonadaceae bacterium]|nr:RDD family protein [Gemmatimonadaceae bacterium]